MEEDEKLKKSIALSQEIKKNRRQFEDDFNNNFKIHEKVLVTLVSSLEHANYNNFTTASVIWNLSGYVNLASYDLKIIGRDLTICEDNWQRKFYARQAYLLIYESANDILELFGKSLRKAIENFADVAYYKERIKSVVSTINSFKVDHEEAIKAVRHTSIGHRDKDMFTLLKSIESIDWYDATKILMRYDGILRELGKLCQELMSGANDELTQKL